MPNIAQMGEGERIEAGMFAVYEARRAGKDILEQFEIAAAYNLTADQFKEARRLAARPDCQPDDVITLVEETDPVWRVTA